MTLEVLFGEEAHELIRDRAFGDQWRRLVSACPWSTFYQDVEFVRTWFAHYATDFAPLVAFECDQDGDLRNLLLLSVDRSSGRAVSSGAHQAEYQCWLSKDETDAPFLSWALVRIGEMTGQDRLTFRYVPTGLMDRLDGILAEVALPSTLRKEQTPIVSLTATPPPWDSLRKKSNQSRLSRLRRMGPVEFDISDSDGVGHSGRCCAFVKTLASMYDLRQGATNDVLPFLEDSRKAPFHVSLLTQANGFRSIELRVGTDVGAAIIGPCWRDTFSVGVFGYNPLMARHSPGKFLILMGEKSLLEHGVRQIDLTPGGSWKWRFANESHEVGELTFHFTKWSYFKSQVKDRGRSLAKSILEAVGLNLERRYAAVAALQAAKPSRVIRGVVHKIAPRKREKSHLCVISAERAREVTPGQDRMNVDSTDDFLRFEPFESSQNRRAFLQSAINRLQTGAHGYTYVDDGVLLHCAWLAKCRTGAHFIESDPESGYPENAAVLCDFLTHPSARGRGLCRSAIRQMLCDAAKDPEIERIYLSFQPDDELSRDTIDEIGFILVK